MYVCLAHQWLDLTIIAPVLMVLPGLHTPHVTSALQASEV